jgi:hypothetical protein
MRTIIMAGIGPLIFASAAYADKLPSNVLGKWCHAGEYRNDARYSRSTSRGDCGDGWMEVKPREIEEWESGCRFTAVHIYHDSNIVVATKTPGGGQLARVAAKCGGEGCEWRASFELYNSKGDLIVRNRRQFGKQVCKG